MEQLLRSTRIVTPTGIVDGAIHISGDRITAVSAAADIPTGIPVQDFGNFAVLPGLVDPHVHINEPGPLHPQRFRRKPGITAAQSLALYNDLKNNGCLGSNNYLIKSNKVIEDLVKANPQNWPGLAGLGPQELAFVQDQINVLWSAHHFTPDFDGYTLRFIRDACGKTSAVAPEPGQPLEMLKISPNPTAGHINVSIAPGEEVRIFNLTGQAVLVAYGPAIDVSVLLPGLYVVRTATGIGKLIRE